MNKKILCAALRHSSALALAFLLAIPCSLFAQQNDDVDVYDVDVREFTVDGVDRAGEVTRAQYVFDYEGGSEELFVYGTNDALLEHLTLADYTIDYQEYDYEELYFSSVTAEKLSAAAGEKLEAYAEYDWTKGGYVYWDIYNTDTDTTRIEIEFWNDSMAVESDDSYGYGGEDDDYDESRSEVVEVSKFTVDGVDRTADVKSAEYRYSYYSETEELYLYGEGGVLLERITVSDYELEKQEQAYEELYFYEVSAEKLPLSDKEGLEAYAEYDWSPGGYVLWNIYNAETGKTRIEVEFWGDSLAMEDDDYYNDDDDDYEEAQSEIVDVLKYTVDGVDRTADVKSAEYRYSYYSETEELYLYGDGGVLIERITVSDYELENADDDYEELYFYEVSVEKLALSDREELEAYAEYDWAEEYVYWEIYDAKTRRMRIEVTFW